MSPFFRYLLIFIVSFSVAPLWADRNKETPPKVAEAKTIQVFNRIKNNPLTLYMFLIDMPKGGDLHNHASGAVYAENLLRYAKAENICIDKKSFSAIPRAVCSSDWKVGRIENNSDLYRTVINAWSMNNFIPDNQASGEQHFFDTFYKFFPIIGSHAAEIFSEIFTRAAQQKENYMELMITLFDLNQLDEHGESPVIALAKKIKWDPDFSKMRNNLLSNNLIEIVKQTSSHLTTVEQAARKQMHCGEKNETAGCSLKVRYIYIALRDFPPEEVFAQLLAGFETANRDPRVVGINIVQGEDDPVAVRDYNLHMQMIQFLHKLYPNVHISLHAGELAPESVPPEMLCYHVRNAVEIANTQRIGHGVDIAYEDNAKQLLKEMAQKQVLVEINLTSNLKILGIHGDQHPFLLYLRNHVPVALSTDDEGILRTDITREFQRAASTYNLDYLTLKQLARNSITYSFLPGTSLWRDAEKNQANEKCSQDKLGSEKISETCKQFLTQNEKAEQQWLLEKQFVTFEKKTAEKGEERS